MTNSTAVAKLGQPAAYDVRHNCGRLLLRLWVDGPLYLQIRCPRCGGMHVIDTRRQPPIPAPTVAA